jgi:hypothetical protein
LLLQFHRAKEQPKLADYTLTILIFFFGAAGGRNRRFFAFNSSCAFRFLSQLTDRYSLAAIEAYNTLLLVYGFVTEECSKEKCPLMSAGLRCADVDSETHPRPCTWNLTMDGTELLGSNICGPTKPLEKQTR